MVYEIWDKGFVRMILPPATVSCIIYMTEREKERACVYVFGQDDGKEREGW
jgi:hypothetical protein